MAEILNFSMPLEVNCTSCGQRLLQKTSFKEFFLSDMNDINVCNNCTNKLNLYEIFKNTIQGNFMFNDAYMVLGAQRTIFSINLTPNELYELEFSRFNIPEEAKILQINYTPQGGNLFPNEVHGNITQSKRYYGDKVVLYPRLFRGDNPEETEVFVSVIWINIKGEDHAFDNLLQAFENYVLGEYEEAIIPANVAVEEPLNRYIAKNMFDITSKTRGKRFLQDAATYSHQLNVILPLILKINDRNMLSDQIRGKLNELRKYRNKIVHEGNLNFELSKNKCAELICASYFGYSFVHILNQI